MGIYTIVVTGAGDGHQHSTITEFPDDRTAIGDAGLVVTSEDFSIAVARGSGADAEFLGVWDWSDGRARWTPAE